ncbi:MAG: DNA polymerase beta domain protein region [Acetothermia bacterium 64_32]|nr:MAG: DNA polymerase beta domain protein region [Acetothermia bacterium 64_32]MBC7343886.1 nucleotidyltransferase domain-containing protein [Clostridia bacterium]HAF70305.1 nucleotidyltransferase domain-containing protein [Candidatus Acetothermia bacterium]
MTSEKLLFAAVSEDIAEVRRILSQKLQGYKVRVYLFGSRVKGQARKSSDLDVALLPLEPLPLGIIAEIREALEESHVPFEVDIVDLSEVDPDFRERILSEGVPWNVFGS